VSQARIFRSIYRLDFPPSFALVDRMGEYAAFMAEEVGVNPLLQKKGTRLDLLNHVVTSNLTAGEDRAALSLTLNSFDLQVDYKVGNALGEAHKHATVEFATELFRKIQGLPIRSLERIGIRHWILVEDDKFEFSQIRDLIVDLLRPVRSAIATSFPTIEDVAAIFEACTDDGTHSRTILGPYRKAERERHFPWAEGGTAEIDQALIVDVDLWQSKMEIPAFSISATAKTFEKMAHSVVNKLTSRFLEDLRERSLPNSTVASA
jgi:hypothetical protein